MISSIQLRSAVFRLASKDKNVRIPDTSPITAIGSMAGDQKVTASKEAQLCEFGKSGIPCAPTAGFAGDGGGEALCNVYWSHGSSAAARALMVSSGIKIPSWTP